MKTELMPEEFIRNADPFAKKPVFKPKPIFRWKEQKLFCGDVLLCAYEMRYGVYMATLEFESLVFEYFLTFNTYIHEALRQGQSIKQAIEELYLKGFERIEINFNSETGDWNYAFDWQDDFLLDRDDKREFLIGHAGEVFLGVHGIGALDVNERNEYTFTPYSLPQEIARQAKGRLLPDNRLMVPADGQPRAVVESVLRDTLNLLEVELIPKIPQLPMKILEQMPLDHLRPYLCELHENVYDTSVFAKEFSCCIAAKANKASVEEVLALLELYPNEPLQSNVLVTALHKNLGIEVLLPMVRRTPMQSFNCFTTKTVIRSGNRDLIEHVLRFKQPNLSRSKDICAKEGYEVHYVIKCGQELEFTAVEHLSFYEALQYMEISRHNQVVLLGNRIFTMFKEQAISIAALGCKMVYFEADAESNIVSFPLNADGSEVVFVT